MLTFFGMMEPDNTLLIWAMLTLLVLMFLPMILLLLFTYKKVPAGQALVRSGFGGTRVSFDAIMVFPIFHQAEKINLTMQQTVLKFEGREALHFKNNTTVDLEIVFYFRVNNNDYDVRKVAETVGTKKTFDIEYMSKFYLPFFMSCSKSVAEAMEIDSKNPFPRDVFLQKLVEAIGIDLNGYILDNIAIPNAEIIFREK